MAILVSGSLAYDYIMDFPDSFKNHILPDQIHILNVSFEVEKLRKGFGGCAGNIAYTMKLLGAEPVVLAALGSDAKDYLEHFEKLEISAQNIKVVKDKFTASAYITTDKDDNQIIAFYSGAGDAAGDLDINQVKEKIDLALITPAKKNAMIRHAKECYDKKIPFAFDPSHQLPVLTSQELMMVIGQSQFFIGNDYEMKLVQEKTGWDEKELLNHVEVLITTLGDKGSVIKTKDKTIEVGICPAVSCDDPTGAGDAYRAGFFSAYAHGFDLKTCGQAGAVAATYTVEKYGTQTHQFTIKEFEERYYKTFKESIALRG